MAPGSAEKPQRLGAQHGELERVNLAFKVRMFTLASVMQKLKVCEETRPRHPWALSPRVPLQGGSMVTDDEVEVAFLEEKGRRRGAAPGAP